MLDGVKDTAMRAKLKRLQQSMQEPRHKERIAAQKKIDEVQKKASVVQLPLWPESARGVPNSVLRGALFAAIQGKNRQALKRAELAAPKGMQIRFTGWQLDQSDLDVWEQCLHLARQHPLGTRCDFTAHAFLKALGRKTGKSDYEWLKDVFARLAGAVVEITHDNKAYFGALIEGGVRDETSGLYRIEINSNLAKLYSAGWTATDWEQRQALRGKPLALWLHGYYFTHADPYPVKVEMLRKLCGSRTKELWKYKQNLKNAHDDLQAVGAINGYAIEGDLVSIDRTPSRSQQKHLRKAKPRNRQS